MERGSRRLFRGPKREQMNIAIIGTGYVGLVTGAGLAQLGNRVVCLDVDDEKINGLKEGRMPFFEQGLAQLVAKNQREKRLSFTTNIAEGTAPSEIIFIAVGTPSKKDGQADLTQVIDVARALPKVLNTYKIIAIKSTVPIGTLELVIQMLTKAGLKESTDFDIAFAPEFLREGDAVYDFFNPTRIVIGSSNSRVMQTLDELFLPLNAPIIHTTPITAQMIKYAANAFLASRISFINEIANICDKVGADVAEVANGLGYDKRLGEGYLSAGIGFGGPCLIKDLNALIKMSEQRGYEAQYLKAIIDKNEHQIRQIVFKIKEVLGSTLYDKVIGVLGLTFKANTNDVRTSLAIKIIRLLQNEGAMVKAYDPKGIKESKELLSRVKFCKDPYQAAEDADVLLILTAWEEFKELDLNRVKKLLGKLFIIDGVNIFNPEKLRKMGFTYQGVGR